MSMTHIYVTDSLRFRLMDGLIFFLEPLTAVAGIAWQINFISFVKN